MINYKYLSTAFITATLLSTASYASSGSDNIIDTNANKRSLSSNEVVDWVQVKKETPEPGGIVLSQQQYFVPTIKDLRAVISEKKGKNRLNPSGSLTNCLDCSIAFFNYINTGRIEPAANNPSTKPNVLLASGGVSLIDGDLAENLCSMKDRPDIIVLEGDKIYQYIDVDGRAQVRFKACGMLHDGPNLDQHDNPIKQEPLLTLEQTLDAIPLTNGKAVGCIYLEFLPEYQARLGADNGFTGHFQNFYIYTDSNGKKEILIVDAQDGEILKLKDFRSQNWIRSNHKQTLCYKNRMYVWWDRNAASEGEVKPELSDREEDEDILTWSHLSEGSESKEKNPEKDKRSPSLSVEDLEGERTQKRITLPPKEKEEADEPLVVQALAHEPAAPMLLVELRQIANWQRQIIELKRDQTTVEDRVVLAEYNHQLSTLAQDPEERKHHMMLAAQQVEGLLGHRCYNNRLRTLIASIWGQAELREGLPDIYPMLEKMAKNVESKRKVDNVVAYNGFLVCLQAYDFAPSDDYRCVHQEQLNDLSELYGEYLQYMLDKEALASVRKSFMWARSLHTGGVRINYVNLGTLCRESIRNLMASDSATDEDLMFFFQHTDDIVQKTRAFQMLYDNIRKRERRPSPEYLRNIHDISRTSVNIQSAESRHKPWRRHVRHVGESLIDLARMRISVLADNATAQDYFDLAEACQLTIKSGFSSKKDVKEWTTEAQEALFKVHELKGAGEMPAQYRELQQELEPVVQPAPASKPLRFTLKIDSTSAKEQAAPAVKTPLQFTLKSIGRGVRGVNSAAGDYIWFSVCTPKPKAGSRYCSGCSSRYGRSCGASASASDSCGGR